MKYMYTVTSLYDLTLLISNEICFMIKETSRIVRIHRQNGKEKQEEGTNQQFVINKRNKGKQ